MMMARFATISCILGMAIFTPRAYSSPYTGLDIFDLQLFSYRRLRPNANRAALMNMPPATLI